MECPHCNKHINHIDYIIWESEKSYNSNPKHTDEEIKEMMKDLYNKAFPEPSIDKKHHKIIGRKIADQFNF